MIDEEKIREVTREYLKKQEKMHKQMKKDIEALVTPEERTEAFKIVADELKKSTPQARRARAILLITKRSKTTKREYVA